MFRPPLHFRIPSIQIFQWETLNNVIWWICITARIKKENESTTLIYNKWNFFFRPQSSFLSSDLSDHAPTSLWPDRTLRETQRSGSSDLLIHKQPSPSEPQSLLWDPLILNHPILPKLQSPLLDPLILKPPIPLEPQSRLSDLKDLSQFCLSPSIQTDTQIRMDFWTESSKIRSSITDRLCRLILFHFFGLVWSCYYLSNGKE
jgi:hypothetical protein